jgi:HTH-type transcriptional regulator/antitoxin HigA
VGGTKRGKRLTSELKPIRTEADYDKALAEVERLWDAKLDTPEGNRFEVLVSLIEAYEDEHYPMPMGETSPGPSSREH